MADEYDALTDEDWRSWVNAQTYPLPAEAISGNFLRRVAAQFYRLGQQHERAKRRCYRCGEPATIELCDRLQDATGATGPAFVCDRCAEGDMCLQEMRDSDARVTGYCRLPAGHAGMCEA